MRSDILVLAIGNDIIRDDGTAFEAAKLLKEQFQAYADFEEVFGGGLEILDFLEGRIKTLVLDTISTGQYPIGTVLEFEKDDFEYINTSSPHYVGLPEVIKLSSIFEIDFPQEIKILAIETEIHNEISEGLSPEIQDKLPFFIQRAADILNSWLNIESS